MPDENEMKQEKAKPINTLEKHLIAGIDFEEIRSQRIQIYKDIEIDLSSARSNEEIIITGTYLYALEGSDAGANLDVRFNELTRPAINLTRGRSVKCPFFRLFVTNTAQAGKTLTLIVGIEEGDIFEVIDRNRQVDVVGFETFDYIRTQRDDNTFMVMQYLSGNATYNYTYHGLTNPAASGKDAYVQRFLIENVELANVLKTLYFQGSTEATIGGINTYAEKTNNFSKQIPTGTQNVCKPFTGRHNGLITTYYGAASTYSHENKDNGIELIQKDAIRIAAGYSLFAVFGGDVNVSSIIEWIELTT